MTTNSFRKCVPLTNLSELVIHTVLMPLNGIMTNVVSVAVHNEVAEGVIEVEGEQTFALHNFPYAVAAFAARARSCKPWIPANEIVIPRTTKENRNAASRRV